MNRARASEDGRFGGVGCFLRVGVNCQRKLAIDYAQIVTLLQLVERFGELAAGRTLEVAEFLEGDRRVGRPENVDDLTGSLSFSLRNFRCWVGGTFGAVEKCAAADREQRNTDDDDKREITPHEKGRKI